MGSSPTAPTGELPANYENLRRMKSARRNRTGHFCHHRALDYAVLYRLYGLALHFGEHVRVGSRVMAMVACPGISETTFGLTFLESSRLAHVCRRS